MPGLHHRLTHCASPRREQVQVLAINDGPAGGPQLLVDEEAGALLGGELRLHGATLLTALWFRPNRGGLPYAACPVEAAAFSELIGLSMPAALCRRSWL